MYFDRFDIVEAYYCFAYNYLTGYFSLTRAFRRKPENRDEKKQKLVSFCRKVNEQLERVKFKPRLSLERGQPKHLTENSKVIYMNLVNKYFA